MNRYVIYHTHEYGVTPYYLETAKSFSDLVAVLPSLDEAPSDDAEELLEKLGIDYEPEKMESLDLSSFDSIRFVNID